LIQIVWYSIFNIVYCPIISGPVASLLADARKEGKAIHGVVAKRNDPLTERHRLKRRHDVADLNEG
jgi:hypothetical protein